jgi:glycosyltransferase involved in cell wall biosynthesis
MDSLTTRIKPISRSELQQEPFTAMSQYSGFNQLSRGLRQSLLVVMPTYPPAHSGGGLRIHRQYLRIQNRLNLPVKVLSSSGRGIPAGESALDGVTVFRLPEGGALTDFMRIGRFLLCHRPAAVHCAGDTAFNYIAAVWALFLRIPLIKERTMNSDFSKRWIQRILFQAVHRHATLCIALNRMIAGQFSQAGAKESRIFCRPNPVDETLFCRLGPESRKQFRADLKLPPGAKVHLVIGRFSPRKNQLEAVKALGKLTVIHHLLLAGPVLDGDDAYFLEIQKTIRELGLESRVLLRTEQVDPVSALYHAADTLWIPSTAEGTPNVMLEALCCGIPVVLNETLGLEEYVNDGINGLHTGFPDPDFAARLSKLLDSVNGDTIAKDAALRFDAHKIDRDYLQHLQRINPSWVK